jgi:hypothetical protein
LFVAIVVVGVPFKVHVEHHSIVIVTPADFVFSGTFARSFELLFFVFIGMRSLGSALGPGTVSSRSRLASELCKKRYPGEHVKWACKLCRTNAFADTIETRAEDEMEGVLLRQ